MLVLTIKTCHIKTNFKRSYKITRIKSNILETSSNYLRKNVLNLKPYTPIEPYDVLSTKYGIPVEKIVKLDANENLYGPPPEVYEALKSAKSIHIYPDPESRKIRNKLSNWAHIPMENLMVGAGADELIDLIMRCVLNDGEKIINCIPTFPMYSFDADVIGAKVINIKRLDSFRIDIKSILFHIKTDCPKIIFLTSPNNPDGSIVSDAELKEILALPILVILDEAYIEFSDVASRMSWVLKYDNLIVLRTFSKCAALAGIRLGYGAFPTNLISFLWRAKQPYNVSYIAEICGCAALDNIGYIEKIKKLIIKERINLHNELKNIPFLNPIPSQSNFILCNVIDINAMTLRDELRKRGIMIRYYDTEELKNYIRISVGKPEHTQKLINELNNIK